MNTFVFEILTIISWSITYILIIIASHRSRDIKKVSMPYVAGVLNFGWEICALHWSHGFWGYILWFTIDLLIVYFGFVFLDNRIKKISYLSSILVSTAACFYIFSLNDGLIYSVYTIDLIMAVYYLIDCKKLSPYLKIPIAFAKLLGDFFAGLAFGKYYNFVVIIAILVLMCNVIYLYICIKEKPSSLMKKR